jgi:hypoxanthine phosphoribosyltransferase
MIMTLDPYDHAHSHVEEVTWSRLGKMLVDLADSIRRHFRPEVVVGIAKGGVIPAVYLGSAFRVDFFPVKVSSRHNEEIVSQQPEWFVRPTPHVQGKDVLIVDDISVAGRTLKLVAEATAECGARTIRTACLAAHKGSVMPDFVAIVTDALIVWPWDRDMLTPDGGWALNPEYLEQMKEIPGYVPGPSPADEPAAGWKK